MLPSFLAYVTQQHKLGFEDVATDALTYVLKHSSSAKDALRSFLNERIADLLPPHFSVETRFDTQSHGIPDIVLRDGNVPRVIIEAKFSAGLTSNQPVGYLNYLENERQDENPTLLAFLVPESKLAHYREEVEARCAHMPVSWQVSYRTHLRSFIHIMTWTEMLQILKNGTASKPEFGMFLQDLERMCQLAEPDDYRPLSGEEISQLTRQDSPLASRMRNFMDLASEIAKRSFGSSQKEWSKYNNAWGPTWSGTYGSIAGIQAWIGVDATAWSEWGVSPIWLQLIGKNKLGQIEGLLLSLRSDIGYFFHPNGEQLGIPIRLGTGLRDEVLEQCCSQVTRLEQLFTQNSK